jgi:hypothetical protein
MAGDLIADLMAFTVPVNERTALGFGRKPSTYEELLVLLGTDALHVQFVNVTSDAVPNLIEYLGEVFA